MRRFRHFRRRLQFSFHFRQGDLDFAVGNDSAANRVYRNNGGGNFSLPWSSTQTDKTRSVVWADFDRDGDLDMLAGNYGEADRVYLNGGGGNFTTRNSCNGCYW